MATKRKNPTQNPKPDADSMLHQLQERAKEQTCLYKITKLGHTEQPLDTLLQKAVDYLPEGFQYPQQTTASITFGSNEYKTKNHKPGKWALSASRNTDSGETLVLTVYYQKSFPKADEGPFLKEERQLLDTIADNLVLVINQKQSQAEMALMLHNTEESFILINRDLNIISFNRQFALLYKKYFDKDVIKGTSILDYTYPERREILKSIYKKVLAGGKEEAELSIPWKGGTDRTIHLQYKPAYGLDGAIIGAFVTIADITAKREAEAALKESEEKYRLLYHNSPLPKFIYRLHDLQILDVNDQALRIYGYTRTEFLQFNLIQLHPKDQHATIKSFHKGLQHNNEVVRIGTFRHHKKDGTPMDLELSGQPFQYQHEPCMMVACHDVTDQKRQRTIEQLEHNLLESSLEINASPEADLETYLAGLEKLFPDAQFSLLRVKDGRVYKMAAPSLPKSYVDAIDGEAIGPNAGSCGTAAYTGERVIATDIRTDPRWKDYKTIALKYNLLASWSQPIFNSEGKAIATFANYYQQPKQPTQIELDLFQRAASLLSIILENHHKSQELLAANERYHYVHLATKDAIYDWSLEEDHLQWGKSYEQLFGYTLTEEPFPISKWAQLVHPDDLEAAKDSLDQFLANPEQKHWTCNYRYQRSNGTFAHVHERGYAIRNKVGKVTRMIGVLSDVSAQKEEEDRLRLLESVVTNANDAILITEAEPINEPGPRIRYVNEAFTKMTGYTAGEVIGKSPRILQGPKTDRSELDRVRKAMENWQPVEATVLNYKKNGQPFWINFSISPVADDTGWFTHWISIERDVTARKQAEMGKQIIADISQIFNNHQELIPALEESLAHLAKVGDFVLAETWLVDHKKERINLIAKIKHSQEANVFYQSTEGSQTFARGEDLPGTVWKKNQPEHWNALRRHRSFKRCNAAKEAGIDSAFGLPLESKEGVIGVLLLGTLQSRSDLGFSIAFLQDIATALTNEVNRKQLETEIRMIFDTAPDIICLVDKDGTFRRMNEAGRKLLGFSQEELWERPFPTMVHPDDHEVTLEMFGLLKAGEPVSYFENRCITASKKTIWLAWTASPAMGNDLVYAVAKDITEIKKLQALLDSATQLARIGAWEVDLINNTVYWSPMVREIHETPEDYTPNLDAAINFYREDVKAQVAENVNKAMEEGSSWEFELPIITAKGRERWVRSIGEVELMEGKPVRIFGSFQDIHDRKMAELRLQNTADNIPGAIFQYTLHPDGTDSISNLTQGAKLLWNLTPEACMEDINLIWDQIKGGGDYPLVKESIEHSTKTMEPWHSRFRSRLPNGRIMWHEGYGIPQKLPDGSIRWDSIVLDITEQKQTEQLLEQASNMAHIGSWELNLIEQEADSMYWSPMTREILEVDDDYNPSLTGGFEFYDPESKERIKQAVDQLINTGQAFDEELLITTAKGKKRWIRCIGRSEHAGERCIRIFGSYQDIDKQKRTEYEVKATLEEKNDILESIGDAFFALDTEWTVTYWNKEAEKLLGDSRDEIVGNNLWDKFPDAQSMLFYTMYHKAMETGQTQHFEEYYPNTNQWFEVSAYPNEKGLSVYFKDVTIRKKAEEEIRRSNERFELVSQVTNDALYDWNIERDEFQWGDGFYRIFGHKVKGTFRLKDWNQLMLPEDVARLNVGWDEFLEDPSRNRWQHEFRFKCADGHYAMVEEIGHLIRDDQGKPVRMIGVLRDVTAEKEAQEQIRQSNERFEKVAEATNDAIWDWNVVHDTLFWGKGFQTLFGYDVDKITPTLETWQSKIHPDNLQPVMDSLSRSVEDPNQRNFQMEYRYQRANGEYAFVVDRGVIVRDSSGKARRMVGAITDITEQKKHESALKNLNAQLEARAHELAMSNAELEQFAYVASHDLQEPLRMVSSFLTQLEKKYGNALDEKAHQYIHFAVDGATRMRQIILDLLEFSRVGKHDDELASVDLNDVMAEAEQLNRRQIEETSATLIWENLPTIRSFRTPILQVLQNLIANSLKYHRPDVPPEIEIKAWHENKEHIISVSDNGIGIDPEYFDKIFVIFQRLHTKEDYSGTGMGLAIVKKIADNLGGRVWVESEPGKGSTFYFAIRKQ